MGTMKIDVTHVAKLANLPLSDEEKKKFEPQLSSVLNYVEQLQNVDTEKVEPTSQVTGLETVTREDVSSPSLSQKIAVARSTNTHNGLFKVKALIDND